MRLRVIMAFFVLALIGIPCQADELVSGRREEQPPALGQTKLGQAAMGEVSRRNERAGLESRNIEIIARTDRSEEIRDPLTGVVVQRTLFGENGDASRVERYETNGMPISTTSFNPGEEETDTQYGPDGKVTRKIIYKSDVLMSSTEYGSDGGRTVIQKSGENQDGKPIYTVEPAPNP